MFGMGVASAFVELFEQSAFCKHVWSVSSTRVKEFWFPIARGKIRSSANCQCLWANWSNCFPTLACNNLISQDSQGQILKALELKFWRCLCCVKFADVLWVVPLEISRVFTKFHQGLMDASPVEGDVCVFFDLVWAFADSRVWESWCPLCQAKHGKTLAAKPCLKVNESIIQLAVLVIRTNW